MWVARNTAPAQMVQGVCDHRPQITGLQNVVTGLKAQQFLYERCDHSTIDKRKCSPQNRLAELSRRPATEGTSEEPYMHLAVMTRDTQESRQVVCSLRMQLANAQMLAARMAPAAPLGGEDNGQKIPDSPDDLRADRTQLIGSIGQLHMVI